MESKPCSTASWTLPSQILTRLWCRDRLEETTSNAGTWSEGQNRQTGGDKTFYRRLTIPCKPNQTQALISLISMHVYVCASTPAVWLWSNRRVLIHTVPGQWRKAPYCRDTSLSHTACAVSSSSGIPRFSPASRFRWWSCSSREARRTQGLRTMFSSCALTNL